MSDWPDLPRPVRRYRSVPGENPVAVGRKFCSLCGRWRLLMDFAVGRYGPELEPLYLQSHCRTCTTVRMRRKRGYEPKSKWTRRPGREQGRINYERLKADSERMERRREYWRIYLQGQRREAGIPERNWRPGGTRDPANHGKADAVDSGPFLEWLARWQASQDDMREWMRRGTAHPVAGLEDLAEVAGCSVRAFWRARVTGRISYGIVDRVLVAAGADTMLVDLYPELYPGLYDEAV